MTMMNKQDTQAERFLKNRGIMVWPLTDGYVIMVNNRRSLLPFRIEADEIDAILSLGRIKRLEVLTTEIHIEMTKT
jgi:hypothetical protein